MANAMGTSPIAQVALFVDDAVSMGVDTDST
jgi:hypothetical protein